MEQIPFTLPARDGHPAIAGTLNIESGGISLSFAGYTNASQDAIGSVLYLEVGGDGHPSAIAWTNVNSEDPIYQISIRGAHASYWVDPEAAL